MSSIMNGVLFFSASLILYISCVGGEKVRCELGAFLESAEEAVLIDSGTALGDTPPDSCEEGQVCATLVLKQVEEGTLGGNLSLVVDDQGYTVGDVLCDKAEAASRGPVWRRAVRIFWRLCGSEWVPTSFHMLLCCEDGLYLPCDTRDEL